MAKRPRELPREEEFVRACIEQELGVKVSPHDDGSRPGMFDLKIEYPDRPMAPVEVSSAVNDRSQSTLGALSRHGKDGIWAAPGLTGVWCLETQPVFDVRRLRASAEGHLAVLAAAGLTELDSMSLSVRRVQHRTGALAMPDPVLGAAGALLNMGVERAAWFDAEEPREPVIFLLIGGGSGSWDGTAEAVVDWIDRYMKDQCRQDNITKLAKAGGQEAHLAVYADIGGVDWPVWRAIEDRHNSDVVPTIAPTLVPPVTHLWLFSNPGGRTGIAWNPQRGWHRFSCFLPVAT